MLWLQKLRELTNDFFTPFMEPISLFAISYLILIPVLIYRIGDKKKGLFPLASFYMCIGINVVVKLTACIYRPWIRDARVIPAGDAISTATGYSFPSGHVATSGPIYAGLAKVYHDSKKWISWICVILLLITAFSRNYLGVHTPQDVIIALLETVLSVYVIGKIFRYPEEKPERENILLLLQFLFAVAALVYVTFKPYPMEYKDGVLIVDPQKMMNDGYGDLAMTMIFPIARFIEKKWIRFRPVGCNKKGLIAGIIGSVFFALINQLLKPCLVNLFGSHWGKFLGSGILVFFCIAAYPLIIKLLFNKEDKTEE